MAARDDIEGLIRWYAERYMAGDAEGVAARYEAPFLAVRNGMPIHLPDRAAVMDHLAGLMAGYRHSGAAVADPVTIEIEEQGEGAAHVDVHWNVRAADGAMVRDFRTSYQLVGPDPWRFVSYVNHDQLAPPRS